MMARLEVDTAGGLPNLSTGACSKLAQLETADMDRERDCAGQRAGGSDWVAPPAVGGRQHRIVSKGADRS
jgi:hypothetical protein